MPLISSPVTYPPSSSPPQPAERHKRRLQAETIYPSKRKSVGSNGTDTSNQPYPSLFAERDILKEIQNTPNAPHKSKGPFVDDDDEEDEGNIPLRPSWPTQLHAEEESLGLEDPILAPIRDDTQSSLPRAATSSGRTLYMRYKARQARNSYEKLIAARSTTAPGKATKSFYGVNIHALIDEAREWEQNKHIRNAPSIKNEAPDPFSEAQTLSKGAKKRINMMWTEKYRARKFTDLVGDERTHRDVLRWLKHWDPLVFPGSAKPRLKKTFNSGEEDVKPHRKILMLTGPAGLGKTTLAHVCARQAGYEVVEINASDERTSQVVKGRIKDCVGTENVKGVNTNTEQGKVRKAGRPVCVVVDEVDGVVSGNGGSGEGGFIKALIDLVNLDQKNANILTSSSGSPIRPKKKKGEKFRLLRPMILICNDVYHPSLRPLRASNVAEIIHIRKPTLEQVVTRLESVFEKERLQSDSDGVRRMCEAAWGVTSRKESRSQASAEGDMRGILVVGEWAASKLRASSKGPIRLTKAWVEENVTESLSHGGGGARGIGRGGAKEAVERVFLDGAGFAKSPLSGPLSDIVNLKTDGTIGVAEAAKKNAMERLRDIIDTSGESDRIVTDCFAAYPSHPFQDDTFLSKPNAACEWLHFHDQLSSRVHFGQEWELGSYLSHSILGLHHLFASPARQSWTDHNTWTEDVEEPSLFSGPRADYSASEALKTNKATLQTFYSSLSIPLMRLFRSSEESALDFLPHLLRTLTPHIKPIIVGGSGEQAGIVSVRRESERRMLERAVTVMDAVGVTFEKTRVDTSGIGRVNHIYRMEPPLDNLTSFSTPTTPISQQAATETVPTPTRFAIRQAMQQEYTKYQLRKNALAREARYLAGGGGGGGDVQGTVNNNDGSSSNTTDPSKAEEKIAAAPTAGIKRDFFNRPVPEDTLTNSGSLLATEGPRRLGSSSIAAGSKGNEGRERKVWVSFHEGFSNAVRKPITLEELMSGFF